MPVDGDPILISAYPKILHYLSRRPHPVVVPVFDFPAVFAANPVEELVEEIRAAGTRVVIFDPTPVIPIEDYRLSQLAPELYELIVDDFELVARVDSLEVRVRRDSSPDHELVGGGEGE